MGLGKYIKTAFLNQWHLLGLIGAATFALISGRADIALPIVAAGELGYLAFVATHPKFQAYVDIHEAQGKQAESSLSNERTLQHILHSLPKSSLRRYQDLRERCLGLQALAANLRVPGSRLQPGLEQQQIQGLDSLLWIFLRLLFTEQTLQTFLSATDADRIEKEMKAAERRLAELQQQPSTSHTRKLSGALEDNLQTSRQRLENYRRAEGNYEFVQLELDRLENKINSLAELAVNRQEPDYITSQVSEVASSMLHTEETMSELDFLTHLGAADRQAPPLLRQQETLYIK